MIKSVNGLISALVGGLFIAVITSSFGPKIIGIIIQCRDESARIEHKSVRPFFGDTSILQLIIRRFVHLPYPIVVATTKDSPKTINICKRHMVDVYYPEIAENNVDMLYRELEIKILTSKLALPTLLLLRDILQLLENTADKAEDAADAARILSFII